VAAVAAGGAGGPRAVVGVKHSKASLAGLSPRICARIVQFLYPSEGMNVALCRRDCKELVGRAHATEALSPEGVLAKIVALRLLVYNRDERRPLEEQQLVSDFSELQVHIKRGFSISDCGAMSSLFNEKNRSLLNLTDGRLRGIGLCYLLEKGSFEEMQFTWVALPDRDRDVLRRMTKGWIKQVFGDGVGDIEGYLMRQYSNVLRAIHVIDEKEFYLSISRSTGCMLGFHLFRAAIRVGGPLEELRGLLTKFNLADSCPRMERWLPHLFKETIFKYLDKTRSDELMSFIFSIKPVEEDSSYPIERFKLLSFLASLSHLLELESDSSDYSIIARVNG